MCEYCKNLNNLSKVIPLIRHRGEVVAYLFDKSLYVEETGRTRKYRAEINFCPMCGRKLAEE